MNYYGNIIYSQFINNIINKNVNTVVKTNLMKNEYYDVKLFNINKTINNSITLYGNEKTIGIYQTIGPYSGIVDIIDENDNVVKYTIWEIIFIF